MSGRHGETFRNIRQEHDDAVSALKKAQSGREKGAPGNPAYDPARLDAAIATAGDAYALLLIAIAEAFLREYLLNIGVEIGGEPKLAMMIDKSVKELNARSPERKIRNGDKLPMHSLRVARNSPARGHGRSVFPSVLKVESVVATFLGPFP